MDSLQNLQSIILGSSVIHSSDMEFSSRSKSYRELEPFVNGVETLLFHFTWHMQLSDSNNTSSVSRAHNYYWRKSRPNPCRISCSTIPVEGSKRLIVQQAYSSTFVALTCWNNHPLLWCGNIFHLNPSRIVLLGDKACQCNLWEMVWKACCSVPP